MPITKFHQGSAAAAAVAINVRDKVAHTMAEGLGVNWYASFPPTTYPADGDEARWQRIFEHADWLNLQFIRFGQMAQKLCNKDGGFRTGDASFAQLRRVDAWAARRGVRLVLDPFSIPRAFQYEPWDGAPHPWDAGPGYALGVRDIDGYVSRFVVPYVRHVVRELGCRSVAWFNHVNEPLRGGINATPPGVDDHRRYVEVLAAIRQGLDEAGLSQVGQMGPDTNSLKYWPIDHMLRIGADPDPHIQGYCMHQYHSRFDWDQPSGTVDGTTMSQTIHEQLARYVAHAHGRGKPLLMTELGMFQYGWKIGDPAGPARHDCALLECEFIVRALNAGADGVLRWAWLNPGNSDGWWQLVQTTDGSDQPVAGTYHLYATLMRHIDARCKVLATQVDPPTQGPAVIHALAVENPDGTRTLAIVNDDYRRCSAIRAQFPVGLRSTVRKIVTDPVRKYSACGELNAAGGQIEIDDVLSPMSLTVYTTR